MENQGGKSLGAGLAGVVACAAGSPGLPSSCPTHPHHTTAESSTGKRDLGKGGEKDTLLDFRSKPEVAPAGNNALPAFGLRAS